MFLVHKNKDDSEVVQEFPAGPDARKNALAAEKKNADRLRDKGELDRNIHKRP